MSAPCLTLRSIPAAVVLLTLSSAFAQTAAEHHLQQVTVIENGEELIEATGGSVVTPQDLALLQPRNIGDIFQREAGVTVSGGSQVAQRVHVLGFEQSQLNVTIDGARQPGTVWHHAGNLSIDPSFLQRVEVEAGAAAADAGFASAVGAVRYETVNGRDLLRKGQSVGGRVKLGYGSNGQGFSSNLAAYGQSGAVDWLVMGSRQNGSNYEDGLGRDTLGTAPKATGTLAKLGLQLPEGHRIDLSMEYNRDKANRALRMNMDEVRGKTQATALLDLKRNTITATYTTTQPTAQWDPEVRVWHNDVKFYRPDYDAGNNGDFQADNTAYGFKAQNTFKLGQGKLTAGVDGSRTQLALDTYQLASTASSLKTRLGIQEREDQLGLYAQWRTNWASGLSLSTGARYDWSDFHGQDGNTHSDSGFSGNATLSYLLNENMEAYVAASRTFLGYQWSQTGLYHARDYVTADNFKTARSVNKKIGVNFFGDQWKAGIGYFDTKLMDRSELASGANLGLGGRGLRRNHADDLRSRGWLINAAYQFKHTQVGMNATLAKVSQGQAADALLPEGGDAMPVGNTLALYIDHSIPAWNTQLGASVQVAQKESFSDKALASGFTEQGTYAVANVYAQWQPQGSDQLTLRLGIDNLFDRAYYTRSTYPLTPGRVTPIMAAGRTISVSGTWKF
jgi:hemoglobin/transferrin/lactoferrin receptor protein